MASVTFDKVTKIYDRNSTAIKELSLAIADGELCVFVGPSGCGKSTALRAIAGLESITAGKLLIGDEVVNDRPPQERNIAMVFQNYALYPHMSVRENMEFALRMMKLPKAKIQGRVFDAAEKLGLTEFLNRKPKQLSGGQRQRVAMGRAIVRNPDVFLMDEPLSNLDAKMRVEIRTEIVSLQQRLGTTMVYVTHDQIEAMTMGDRVVVLRSGMLQQVATPQELYDRPANIFVAGFIGSPMMNIFRSKLIKEDGKLKVAFGDRALTLDPETVNLDLNRHLNLPLLAGLRPEAFSLAEDNTPSDRRIEVEIAAIEALGYEMLIYFSVAVQKVMVDVEAVREEELLQHSTTDVATFAARLPVMRHLRSGAKLSLAIDTSQLYLFESVGLAIQWKAMRM